MFFRALFPGIPIVMVSPVVSELIKLVSNCWLATQVCYWNEILKLCKEFDVAPQLVANGCTLDKRISKYGSKMIGDKFSGFCLPKDLNTLLNAFAVKKTDASLLKCIKELNEG
jgi:UDP-glucose 6-dehydrogenase